MTGSAVLIGALVAPLHGLPLDRGGLVVYALLGFPSAALAFRFFPPPGAPSA